MFLRVTPVAAQRKHVGTTDACPTGIAELSHLREACSFQGGMAWGERGLSPMQPMQRCIDIEYFLKWLTTDSVGVDTSYLAGFCGSMPHVHHLQVPAEPHFSGSIEDFREKHKDNASTLERLQNTVKVCAKCGKACALDERRKGTECCNACGASLQDVQQSHSDNIFMGFIYGIAEGKFRYKISMRVQTPEFLCFDDPLQCSPCHLNAIPTSLYCKDLRYLFTNPEKGLVLVKRLYEIGSQAALEQYWDHEARLLICGSKFHKGSQGIQKSWQFEIFGLAFREKIWAGQQRPSQAQALEAWAVTGFNFPPSMFQLHLQFIHLPPFPFHYSLFQSGEHFTRGRFFPLEYMKQALALGDAVRIENAGSCDIESLISKVKAAGVDYDQVYDAMVHKIHALQRKLSPWREADFRYRVMEGQVFEGRSAFPELDPKQVQKSDAQAMCNYGRPYEEGKPSGTYYQFAKAPEEVLAFEES
ncbi:unnamed protein product [Cladocopium goreaui]|uniref:Uncharacterized protein n=1 Tax=Cladocopium goreaui TaxID=2562237 RepID=A0A9P1GIS5_9DINO|nr:unnamed protein product [Cladocopium goreaui]